MSELTVASAGVAASVLALPLLAAAGVAVGAGWVLARLGQALTTSEPIRVSRLAQRFITDAQAAREQFLADLLKQPVTSTWMPSASKTQVIPPQLPQVQEAAQALARAQAIREAFAKQPVLTVVAEAHQGEAIQQAFQETLQAQEAFKQQAFDKALRVAKQAEETLARAAQVALKRLQTAQPQVVAQAARNALSSLGYRVEEASHGKMTAFRAQAGEHLLGVVVLEGEKLLIDAAGFAGTSCRPALEAFYRRLRDQGVEIQPEASLLHQQQEGGPLLMAAQGAQGLLDRAAQLRSAQRSEPRRSGRPQAQDRRRAAAWLWAQQRVREG